jgi:hypothetical protein
VTSRSLRLPVVVFVGATVLAVTAACAPVQHTYAADGRCLHFQLGVSLKVHPSAEPKGQAWDIAFTNTSPVACVFGGVPTVAFRAASGAGAAGIVQRAVSEERAVPLGAGETAYATISLEPPATATCEPVRVASVRIVAPHVKGGGWTVATPAKFLGCSRSVVVARVGQVTAHRPQ